MRLKKILFLCVVFFATFPISWIMGVFTTPVLGLPIAFVLHSLGVYWVTVAGIAFVWSAILTSLFFTYIAWLIKPIKNDRNLIPIVVFFVALPVSLIISFFNPLSRLITSILINTRIGVPLAAYIPALSFTFLTALFFALISWFFVKSKKNSKVQTERER